MPNTIIAVDPGLRACGVAITRHSRLVKAWLSKNPEKKDDGAVAWRQMCRQVLREIIDLSLGYHFDLLVVERQYMPMNRNPYALTGLTAIAGGLVCSIVAEEVQSVWPSVWKGKMDGQQRVEMILQALTVEERRCADGLDKKTTAHNVLDAIGIALWASGRGLAPAKRTPVAKAAVRLTTI